MCSCLLIFHSSAIERMKLWVEREMTALLGAHKRTDTPNPPLTESERPFAPTVAVLRHQRKGMNDEKKKSDLLKRKQKGTEKSEEKKRRDKWNRSEIQIWFMVSHRCVPFGSRNSRWRRRHRCRQLTVAAAMQIIIIPYNLFSIYSLSSSLLIFSSVVFLLLISTIHETNTPDNRH